MARAPSPTSARSFKQDVVAWCVTLLLLGVGGYIWYYWQWHPEARQPLPVRATATDPRIVVLAYDRVVAQPDGIHLTAVQLRSHIEALRSAGFEPISVRDLQDFYHLSAKLPAKPVLLVFDHGYLDTYEAVHPILLATGWRAAMSLATAAQERHDTYYLYWDRLQRMLHSGYWELLSQGHAARELITVNETGNAAPFVTTAMWNKSAQRVETAAEFSQRIAHDLARSAEFVQVNLDTPALGYVFPYGAPERIYRDTALLVAERQARGTSFRLAFSDDEFGVNDRFSDPLDLKRLQVSLTWDTHELLRRVTAVQQFPQTPQHVANDWIAADGDIRVEATQLHLKGAPQARAWLAGSQWENDWTLISRVHVQRGDFWLVHSDISRATEWRFGGNSQGLFLKQFKHGAIVATRTTGVMADAAAWHELKVIKRGVGVWIEWDGRPVWERPERLVDTVVGPIAWMVWSGEGEGELSVEHASIVPTPYTVQVLNNFPAAEEVQRVAAQAKATTALTRAQFTLQARQLVEHPIDRDLFELLRFRYAWEIMPTVTVTSTDDELLSGLDSLPTRAKQEGWGGLLLDLRALSSAEQQGMSVALLRLEQRLRSEQRRLLITRGDGQAPPLNADDLASYTLAR